MIARRPRSLLRLIVPGVREGGVVLPPCPPRVGREGARRYYHSNRVGNGARKVRETERSGSRVLLLE
jgi:hypothetical protein